MNEQQPVLDPDVLMDTIFDVAQGIWYMFLASQVVVCAFVAYLMLNAWKTNRRRRMQLESLYKIMEDNDAE